MEKAQQKSFVMPQPVVVSQPKNKHVGHGFITNCMTTMNRSNKMFTPRPMSISSSKLLDRKRKTHNDIGECSPLLLSNKRQSLKVLQPTAGKRDALVGRNLNDDQDIKKLNFNLAQDSGGDQNDKNVNSHNKPSRSSKRGRGKARLSQVGKSAGIDIYQDAVPPPSSSDESSNEPEKHAANNNDTYAMMTKDEAPEGYWKEIAEERRKALSAALEENQMLHNSVNNLTTENERLTKVAEQAEYFAGIIEDLLGKKVDESLDGDTTSESDSNLGQKASGCKRKRDDDEDELERKEARFESSDDEEDENSLFGSDV